MRLEPPPSSDAGEASAATLLVANERTREALPPGAKGEVITLVENGVDLDVWLPSDRPVRDIGPVRFIFLGRLVDWKAVDLLLEAFARVEMRRPPPCLEIVGDGPMRISLETLANRLEVGDRVHFAGWQTQADFALHLREADVLVLPSLYECGGAVVLEAMACGLPVIAAGWGGPADYIDDSCGILVPPDSREALISGLVLAMAKLAADPPLRAELGRAGRKRVEQDFDWERKIDSILTIYRRVAAARDRVKRL